MDSKPKLLKQRSCVCPHLDIAGWCSSSLRRCSRRRWFSDKSYDELDPTAHPAGGRRLRWKGLWRRITGKSRGIFDSSTASIAARAPYDPLTYAQNFDEGSAWVEPENISRSFSARFAAPSGVGFLQKIG
ncbi:hypothetical protein HPP92_002801 [Vanilla planifolia]|uniref:Uncharacterized protein n=1 Tax=Vanilla planifolia TaxID=51239 RepID=A0A835RT79_VANPL|nr:hypothetical protein HPP92_002801 [Vanilla planifolia]